MPQTVTVIGANGQIARLVEQHYLNHDQVNLKLFARNVQRLPQEFAAANNVQIIEGDARNYNDVFKAVAGSDLVYANLGGVFTPMVHNIVQAMNEQQVRRLIHVTGLGLYHEVPDPFGTWVEESCGHAVMEDTRDAARLIENNGDLDYTIIRAGYMSNAPVVDYELTHRHEPFKGTTISRASIADLIERMIDDPSLFVNDSLGIAQAGTDGATPVYK